MYKGSSKVKGKFKYSSAIYVPTINNKLSKLFYTLQCKRYLFSFASYVRRGGQKTAPVESYTNVNEITHEAMAYLCLKIVQELNTNNKT